MKFIQVFYFFATLALSIAVLGASCLQFSGISTSMEIPFEEPSDEDTSDTKGISDDFDVDKEYFLFTYLHNSNDLEVLNQDCYLISHSNRVKEISTPPPKA